MGDTQRPVRRLSNQISSFRLVTHLRFLAYVQLTFMLCYRIHGFLLTELTVRKTIQSYVFHLSIERVEMKTQHFANIWKAALVPFASSNYTPDNSDSKTFKTQFHGVHPLNYALVNKIHIYMPKKILSNLLTLTLFFYVKLANF